MVEAAIWTAFALAQIADVVSTELFLRRGIAEANLLWHWMQERAGRAWIAPRLLVGGGAGLGLYWIFGSILPVAVMAIGFWSVVGWNVVQIRRSL
jgi:hypothetical protein